MTRAGQWEWDETLYAGSASHYPIGRVPYPAGLADGIRDALGLDGTGRLLDVGCGPGSLTLLLAPLFEAAIGVDAGRDMLAEAQRRSGAVAVHGVSGHRVPVQWRQLRAEQLPADLGTFRVVTFAQSFHWMDRPLVADRVRTMVEPGGSWVHIGADTHRGVDGDDPLPHPRPPWNAIDELVHRYLGPGRRAGQGWLPDGTPGAEEDVMRQAGYTGPTRIEVGGEVIRRSADEVVSSVMSLSSSAPHLFADRLPSFEVELRHLLRDVSPNGQFAERMREIEVVIWRP